MSAPPIRRHLIRHIIKRIFRHFHQIKRHRRFPLVCPTLRLLWEIIRLYRDSLGSRILRHFRRVLCHFRPYKPQVDINRDCLPYLHPTICRLFPTLPSTITTTVATTTTTVAKVVAVATLAILLLSMKLDRGYSKRCHNQLLLTRHLLMMKLYDRDHTM